MATFIQMAPLRTGSDHLGGWWYLRFSHSYRNVEELLSERGLPARHTTSVHCYAPELNKRCRRELKPTKRS